jgi:murein DD-endopeptidase MepM/ murein hydrolase activator NlpD
MTGSCCLRRFLSLFVLMTASIACAQQAVPAATSVTLTPEVVVAGSPELIRVEVSGADYVVGHWLGPVIEFFPSQDRHTWFALAGVDLEANPGPSTLHIVAHTAQGDVELSRDIDVQPAHYRTGTLTVAPKFVEPGPDELTEIDAEQDLKKKVFATSATGPLWLGSFRAPVPSAPTDSFGTRRTFNGKLASVHTGMDFRAPMGTVVRASNSGVVVLARKLYYEGNCVIIDHGLGLYTLSMHFSRIDVHEGEQVVAGQRLGLSGATGRVTGPHLHWAVRWQGANLDPAKLLKLDLSGVQ